jgi:uncharacterized protein YbgA (DUF1722 family)/uncharacterized protein YbbK (DUF523 family)
MNYQLYQILIIPRQNQSVMGEQPMENPIKIGVSSCLLGNNVRYNGGHAHDRFITGTLDQYVEFVPVCPEVECGLGIPRLTMHLRGDVDNPRLITTKTGEDLTDCMVTWAQKRLEELASENLCGFIFKKKSPSSGMARVKVFNDKGQPVNKGRGIFAGMFMDRFPLIPVEEDGRLNDPKLRENFIEQIFTMKRWRDTLANGKTRSRLVDFHTRNKMLLRCHSEKHYRLMGKLVAAAKSRPTGDLYREYEALFMAALRLKSTVAKNTNVMMHMLGYFKKDLTSDEKQEMLEIIETYRGELVPLVVPLTLFSHYVRKYDQPYLKQQTYLNPHPTALKLRNHA